MGVFGAFFGCIGDGGFNGCCSRARSGDGVFMLAYISACRGVIGFKVGTWLCPVREKVRPAALFQRESAKKFALRAQNTPNSAFLRLLGEFFAEMPLEGPRWANFFAGKLLEAPRRANFFAHAGASAHVRSLRCPPCLQWWGVLHYTSSVPHSGVTGGGRPVACYGCGHCVNYMPKGSDRWTPSDANLDVIADDWGECPGKTPHWDAPKQRLELLLRT